MTRMKRQVGLVGLVQALRWGMATQIDCWLGWTCLSQIMAEILAETMIWDTLRMFTLSQCFQSLGLAIIHKPLITCTSLMLNDSFEENFRISISSTPSCFFNVSPLHIHTWRILALNLYAFH